MEEVINALSVDNSETVPSVATPKRMARVDEAIAWPAGPSQDKKIYQRIWPSGNYSSCYSVELGKPGKEAALDFARVNENDMHPSVRADGELIEKDASFSDIFIGLEDLRDYDDERLLEVTACLLFRSAFMVDHKEVESGVWRYSPPQTVIDYIVASEAKLFGVPLEVFLHYIDAIAWNEDVKYHTLGKDIGKGIGRINTLLTCVNLIAVYLRREKIGIVAMGFAKGRGLAAIGKGKAYEYFPMLSEDTQINMGL